MGKYENSRDDSLLMRAFDDAISNYKVMHGQEIHHGSAMEEELSSDREKNLSNILDDEQMRNRVEAEKSKNESTNVTVEVNETTNVTVEVNETTNLSPAKENIDLESCVPVSCADSSNPLFVDPTHEGLVDHSNQDLNGAKEYNQLLNQYYELEEKRQKILEQLYQYGGWNYQNVGYSYGSGVEQGVSYQEHPVSASQISHKHVVTSSYPISAVAAGPENPSLADGNIIKTAMDAAQRALSSMKETTIPGDCDVNKGKEAELGDGIAAQKDGSETDLAVVLNAWFSAGFYTGKYVMEQSHGKK